ncbi:MAG: glycoside hydrolase family 27 protein, partial [Flavisolibacter sp.]
SLCEWGDNKPWEWAEPVGHLWRTTGDIYHCFDCVKDHGTWKSWGVMQILDKQDGLRGHAGPDHWNDPDMMEVGNGLTAGENRAHFSLWAMLAAPLIAGNDLRSMSDETRQILTNKEIISIDQDVLGIQGYRYEVKDSVETWLKPLKDGAWAIAFLNRSIHPRQIDFNWQKEVITDTLSKLALDAQSKPYKVRNIWAGKDQGNTKQNFRAALPAHDVIVLKLYRE